MVSDEQVAKFQTLYKNLFGKEIGLEDAREQAIKLVQLVGLIYKPIKKEDAQFQE
ncbi:MAG: hypothetical protein WCW16_02150 [Candidatus Magasanikbacteria bacterium]